MVGKAAVAVDAERARRVAQVLVAGDAQRALAAADPREDDAAVADGDTLGVGADGHHRAGDLMAERARRLQRARHVELGVAAEVEVAIVQVHVAVANAAGRHAHDDFAALRLRGVAQHLREGFAEFLELIAEHGRLS